MITLGNHSTDIQLFIAKGIKMLEDAISKKIQADVTNRDIPFKLIRDPKPVVRHGKGSNAPSKSANHHISSTKQKRRKYKKKVI